MQIALLWECGFRILGRPLIEQSKFLRRIVFLGDGAKMVGVTQSCAVPSADTSTALAIIRESRLGIDPPAQGRGNRIATERLLIRIGMHQIPL